MINYSKILPFVIFGFISFICFIVALCDIYLDDKSPFQSLEPCIMFLIITLMMFYFGFT